MFIDTDYIGVVVSQTTIRSRPRWPLKCEIITTTTDRRTENANKVFEKSLFTGKLVWRFTYQKHFSYNQKHAINFNLSFTHLPQNVPCPANFHVTMQKMYNKYMYIFLYMHK